MHRFYPASQNHSCSQLLAVWWFLQTALTTDLRYPCTPASTLLQNKNQKKKKKKKKVPGTDLVQWIRCEAQTTPSIVITVFKVYNSGIVCIKVKVIIKRFKQLTQFKD
mmetsp:Transcript_11046/g.20996  ORF Transcript_11046/g.20996 Transcript_11046/m.20996 type:complete len:108 (-) Transcript_11046:29-352(-)